LLKWLRTTSGLNIALSVVAFIASFAAGWYLMKDGAEDWRGVGQSLVAAAAVGAMAVMSAVLQFVLVTKNIEAITQLGIRRIRRRGTPDSRWPKQLRSARSLTFFGRDHNNLVEHQYDLLKVQVRDENVDIHFYLLDLTDPYYTDNVEERKKRVKAARLLYKMKEELQPGDRNRFHLWQYRGSPTFTYTQLDQTIIFGPYLPNLANEKTPEFEIVQGADTWMYDTCKAAFKAAIADAMELARVPEE
jgi:hypothetical protein